MKSQQQSSILLVINVSVLGYRCHKENCQQILFVFCSSGGVLVLYGLFQAAILKLCVTVKSYTSGS